MASRNYTSITLIGGGGHGVVVADAASAAGLRVVGFFDDNAEAPVSGLADHLGPLEACLNLDHYSPAGAHTIIALGRMDLRERFARDLVAPFARVVHPSASVSENATIAAGVFVGPQAVVNPFAHVSEHAIINSGAIVEHDCRVGRNAHIAPGAVLAGGVVVEGHALVGMGARVLPGVTIGAGATVGAGAVVTHDVGGGETVMGVPARGR